MKQSPFRAIRQKLFHEGKLLRYLSYAIGEILLIIIGIMLALQLNNWNEERKAEAEIQIYVEQLKEDVNTALYMVNDLIEDADGKIARELSLRKKLKGEPIAEGELSDFEHALNGLARVPELDFNIGYLGRLMDGDMDAIVGDRELTLQVLNTTIRLKRNMKTINDKVRIIQMADEIFIRHRGRGGVGIKELDMTYDMETLKTSDEFLYAVENAVEALIAIRRNETRCKSVLEDFLVVLEAYK